MSFFEPIAVVGTSCVLPGALSPGELWTNVLEKRNLLTRPSAELWGLDPDTLLRNAAEAGEERVASATGGYVTGFERIFDPGEFKVDTNGLDPLFLWTLWGAREALRQAGLDTQHASSRAGLVLGNLGYPSKSMAKWAEALMLGGRRPDPRNRFHFALPAQLAAKTLQLGLGGYSIDAACASSLYAMKLACERLHDRQADLMVAGGINHSDDLFLHAGFTALGALSPSGRSRPFHAEADGLVPAHGAAFVALKRLSDAVQAGDRILGVIRGIGCSNDGRGAGLLTPSREGQVRAIRQAYEAAGITPSQVSYVECHATGTPVGDSTEIRSMAEIFGSDSGLAIGSLKSNLGHLITASGAAGFVKLLEALRHGIMPPTIGCDQPSETLRTSGFRLLQKPEPWKTSGPRIGAISAFGFGGNNAHVIVEEWTGGNKISAVVSAPPAVRPIAITGVGILAGQGQTAADFLRRLVAGSGADGHANHAAETIGLSAAQVRFPPRDLEHTLPQQLVVLQAAQEAVAEAGELPIASTGVFTGMEVEPGIARHGVRWRLAEQLRERGLEPDSDWLRSVRDRIVPTLDGPATILGNMPNMPANRLNSQFDFRGSGFTVGDGELSGEASLRLALRALRSGELDAALVCAVDLSCDRLHTQAMASKPEPGDVAVALVLCPLEEAVSNGRSIYAVIAEDDSTSAGPLADTLRALFGQSYAASGLLEIAAAAMAVKHRLRFGAGPAAPWLPTQGEWSISASSFRLSAPENVSPAGYLDSAVPPPPAKTSSRTDGELAFVFTGAASAYRGACKDLLTTIPSLGASLAHRFPEMEETAGFVYSNSTAELTALEQLLGSSFVSQLHAELTLRVLKLRPDAMIGLSSGETNYMFASGIWSGIGDMMAKVAASGMYDREIAGEFGIARRHWKQDRIDWINVRVLATAGQIHEAIADEPHVRLLIVHAPGDCLIGGDATACRRVIKKLGSVPAFETSGLACHCPEMVEYAEGWRALHHRPVTPRPDLRIYSNPHGGPYEPTADRVADMLTAQASETVNFARTIRRAWDDGVRIFVEHGPRNLCAGWISKTLGDRPHLAVSLDQFGKPSVEQITQAIHKLAAAGVAMDTDAFFGLLEQARSNWSRPAAGRVLTFPAHRPDFRLEDFPLPAQTMPAPPELPPILEKPVPAAAPIAVPAVAATNGVHATNGGMADATYATLARSIGSAHRNAVQAQVDVLRRTAEARLAVFRDALRKGTVPGPPPPAAAMLPAVAPPVSAPIPVAPPPVPAPAPKQEVLQPEILPAAPSGSTFNREQLEIHAGGRISTIFGKLFEQQDGFRRQVRMPEPPLLFPDRVTGITGEPGILQSGSIWTETDIRKDSWFLHERHVTPGVLIEAGQADLMLVSWQGIDFLNRDQRVYRMLSCELTFKGPLPQVGDTLVYDIHIDEHAQLGDVRLFFFHFDCRVNGEVRLQMRNGQAGFFSDAELADPAGVIWDPQTAKPDGPHVAFDPQVPVKNTYSREQMTAFAEGRGYDCFGEGYENLATHTATPRIPSGRLQLLQEVVALDPKGGPWGRGYMKIENQVSPSDWFFDGHFLNDPCMPGTLMAEAGMQAMSFYLAAMGLTIGRDGWRFEPILNEVYKLRCRGQVTPSSNTLTYEVFVHRVDDGPQPGLFADILGMVDGVKAVHGYRLGVRLVPDWPMEKRALQPDPQSLLKPGITVNDVEFGAFGMLASALGRPSDAFGAMYSRFDGPARTVRLPGPPFLQMTRVIKVSGPPEGMQAGVECEAEYDLETNAWFFRDNGTRLVPLSILMEISLQPCGWLASYAGCVSTSPEDFYLRNLDGSGTVYGSVPDEPGVLTTLTKLVSLSKSGGIILVVFDLETSFNGRRINSIRTSFGFFPKQALEGQVGLAGNREPEPEPSGFDVDLRSRPARYFDGPLRMMSGQLLMLDRITEYWPEGGATKLGRLRAQKDVDPSEWFFKAHFFQDPVMPGSLGVESIMQLLQFYMLEAGLAAGLAEPYFEPIANGMDVVWKYRGQVIPTAKRITVELEVREIVRGDADVTVTAEAWLMVDGLNIYHMPKVSSRIVGKRPVEESGLSLETIWSYWKKEKASESSHPRERLIASLYRNFVGAIRPADPEALRALRGKPVLYLANHQTLMESTLVPFLAPAITGSPLIVMAKVQQKKSQLVQSMARIFDSFSESPAEPLIYFDQSKPASLLQLTERLRKAMQDDGRSALVHVEGVRSLSCRKRVEVVSSALVELAMDANVPIVPVRFTGGLPVEPAPAKQDLPYGLGRQDYWFGKPIYPEELRRMTLVERKTRVLAGINELGPPNEVEEPGEANPEFVAAVKARMKAKRLNLVEAVLLEGAGMPADARLEDLLNS